MQMNDFINGIMIIFKGLVFIVVTFFLIKGIVASFGEGRTAAYIASAAVFFFMITFFSIKK